MKKILITITLLLLVLASCSNGGEDNTLTSSDYDVSAVAEELLKTEALKDGFVYSTETSPAIADVAEFYFGSAEILENVESCVFITSPNEHVSEAGVFKVTNKEAADALLKAFHERQKNLIQIHTNYDQNDLKISENLDMGSFDDVVYFIATHNNAEIAEIIKK